jgi:DNA-binding MarR family transcriptional regulator
MPSTSPVRVGPDFEDLYPGASRSATECAMNLVRTGELVVNRVAEVLRPFGLSPAGGLILSMLADAPGPLTPGEIRNHLIVAGPTVTGLIDSLQSAALVRRGQHPVDRRRILIELTPAGRDLAHRFRPAVHSAQRPWLACLTSAEQDDLLSLLGRIQAHLLSS